MNIADSVQETTAGTSTSIVVVSGATSGNRSLQAAITSGEFVVGRIGPFRVEDDAGNWLTGLFILTNPTTLTRAAIAASSTGGADVTLAGTVRKVSSAPTAGMHRRGTVDPDDVGYDIVLCAGQSNMEGNPPWDSSLDFPDSRLAQFGGSSADTNTYRKIVAGSDPMLMYNGPRTGLVGPCTYFGKAYANSIPSNRRVLLVPVAAGSTGLLGSYWASGNPGGSMYELAITQTNLAITAALLLYPNSRFVGTIWAQGEADAIINSTQAAYATGLKAVIAGFRSRITGAANSWFIISGMVPEYIAANSTQYTPIDLAHKQVASEVDKVTFVAGPTGYANGVHYNAPGIRIQGARLGLAVQAALRSSVSDTTAPTVAGASVSNSAPTVVNLSMSEMLDPAFVPAASAFTVGGHTVLSAAISGSNIALTCSTEFAYAEAARAVAYTKPGTNNARDLAGNQLDNFSGQTITNNVAAPAAAVTLARSAASGVVGNPVTITVGTDSPLTGTQTESVALTSNIAGTFSPTSVTLNAGTVTATATFTPSASGSATITGTATGTPSGLANGTIGYTVTATATVPAAPTIATAVAGDGYVDVAFTRNSDGGSPVIDSTATLSTGQTATGTTSPIRVTATNGVAVTATVKDRNVVGSSVASAASNSVTPAVAVAYTTLNPADAASGVTLSNGNLTATGTSGFKTTRAVAGKSTGKWYFEVRLVSGAAAFIGLARSGAALTNFCGSDLFAWGYYTTGAGYFGNSATAIGGPFSTWSGTDVVGVAVDLDAKTARFYKNGVAQGAAAFNLNTDLSTTPPTIPNGTVVYPAVTTTGSGVTVNFGATAFAYTPPAGFSGVTV